MLRGALAAALTPLADGGEALDEAAFEPYVDFLAAGGLDGLLALGTTGEGFLLPIEARRRAAQLFLDAATALRIGLVHQCTSDLEAAVDHVLAELLSSGPEAARAAKRLIRERPGGEEAAHVAARLRTSSEGQEGLRAFLEKRRAAWRSETDGAG